MPINQTILEVILQFTLLVVAGGYITLLYTRSQHDKDSRQKIIHEYSEIFSHFMSLRFKANVHLLENKNKEPRYHLLPKDQVSTAILDCYNDSCDLLGRYQALKPLMNLNFRLQYNDIDALHQYYQTWRRSLRDFQPVYQSNDPANDAEYTQLKKTYHKLLGEMKSQSNPCFSKRLSSSK